MIPEFSHRTNFTKSLSVHGFNNIKSKKNVVAIWIDEHQVTNDFKITNVDVTFERTTFNNPVIIDLMTGKVYEIPESDWTQNRNSTTFKKLPLYDAPMLIADRDTVVFSPADKK